MNNTVSFLFLYDSNLTQGGIHNFLDSIPEIEGLSVIDLKGDDNLYKRFNDNGVLLKKLPIIMIGYNKIFKEYEYNELVLNQVKIKINQLLKA